MSHRQRYYAHTLKGCPQSAWQDLRDHLEATSEKAARSASAFGAADWGRLAGLWHDLGKYSEAFQEYLRRASRPDTHQADGVPKTDHSTAGAQLAVETLPTLGHLIAYVISGHHSGLLEGRSEGACLESRLTKAVEPWVGGAPDKIINPPVPKLPTYLKKAFGEKDAFAISFFVRMVFSCLVNADFLDTEQFMCPERAAERPVWKADILEHMEACLDVFVEHIPAAPTVVNRARANVRLACLKAGELPPGLFSLTVPTGGGKTLSSLAFALRHALRHGLERIVYVIPFTSIIEQTADEFRKVLEPLRGISDPVLEHHSNLDIENNETVRSRLATENWDAPLIVTTSVQFYESLFANRTSRCRKIHNLARAVIILDEAQTIPVDYLEPCLRTLRELSGSYGSSVVLCTATQPAVHRREGFTIGLEGVREIIADPPRLYRKLKRVEVEDKGQLEDARLVESILEEDSVLCIVNTRGHARKLFEALGKNEAHFHLSALMCPRHRSEVLARIRARLDNENPCRVVSTQLVEAGVDIDFPTVYRSIAGLDSIAQAAGRCNRNGRLATGRTLIFHPEHDRSERFFTDTANAARQVLELYDDPLSLEAVEHYFRLYYWEQSSRWDAKALLAEFHLNQDKKMPFLFGFSTVAERFHLIEETGRPVIVPWREEGKALCDELRDVWRLPGRDLLRQLQRYTVQVPFWSMKDHAGRAVELMHDRYTVLADVDLHYSDKTGLCLDKDLTESLVI